MREVLMRVDARSIDARRPAAWLLGALILVGCDPAPGPSDGGPRVDAPGLDAPGLDALVERPDAGPIAPSAYCPAVTPDPRIGQELPRARVDVTYPTQTGRTITVAAGESLQAAIDGAMGGDTITLTPGATYPGPIYLPDHPGDGWVVIRTASSSLPERRVGPDDAPQMARITAPAGLRAIETRPGAHHYRLVGLEITTAEDAYTTALVDFGSTAETLEDVPHHLVLDRSYLHGAATAGTRRGVALNSAHTAIVGCHFTDFREMGADSQAICGWTGPGPFGIYDNYLAGAAENVMFGGAPSRGPAWNPADIEVCGNFFDKPLTWYERDPSYAGLDWVNKNLFEIKNARRTLFAANVLQHSWGDGQVGFAFVLTPRAEGDPSLEHAMTDVTIAYNLVRDVGAGVAVLSRDDGTPGSLVTERVAITDNVFLRVDGTRWNGAGRGFQLVTGGDPARRVMFSRNTVLLPNGNGVVVLGDSAPIASEVILEDNVLERGMYGLFGSGQGEGTRALDFYVPGHVFRGNVIFGGASESSYPAGNFFPATADDVGFVDLAGEDVRLAPSSPYAASATDGGPAGADVAEVLRLTAGVDG
jgi:hypothetical protein